MLHGGFGTGAQAEGAYGWDEQADIGERVARIVGLPVEDVVAAWRTRNSCGATRASTRVDLTTSAP
jgi:polyhydroxybutyrate depolymerase